MEIYPNFCLIYIEGKKSGDFNWATAVGSLI